MEVLTVELSPTFELLEHWICRAFTCDTGPSSCSQSCIA